MAKSLHVAVLALGAALAAAPATAQEDDGWRLTLTPYLWMAGIQGDVAARPGSPPIDINAQFSDVFAHLTGAFMGRAELGYGRFGLIGDVSYLKVTADKDVGVGNVPRLGAELDVETTASTIAGYYRVHSSPRSSVDLLAGARINDVGLELDLSRAGGGGVSRDAGKSWTDPIVGVRGQWRLGERSSISGYVDYGGFGVSSKAVWQAMAFYNYDLTHSATLSAGYRYYVVDFKNDGFIYDVNLGGPVLGASFKF